MSKHNQKICCESHDTSTVGENQGLARDPVVAFRYDRSLNTLKVLDQTLLPTQIGYIDVFNCKGGYEAIKSMMVRGAPAIAAVGCLAIIAELNHLEEAQANGFNLLAWLEEKSSYMVSSRPTAVNLRNSIKRLNEKAVECENNQLGNKQLILCLTTFCLAALEDGLMWNVRLGDFGALQVLETSQKKKVTVLTHCNTGSLATVGYGTALGVIRSLHKRDNLNRSYCTETRPYNQGSRLTAWELIQENIPATLIADSMVAHLMCRNRIDAVIVGADCVARNGDTANKIGTFQIAVVAKHFGVPFYVAAPTQSFDLQLEDSSGIKIELRDPNELKRMNNAQLAPEEIDAWNPSFDITPAHLITGIITEYGVCTTAGIGKFFADVVDGSREISGSQFLF